MQEAQNLFASLNREIWLVTAAARGERGGLIATSVSHVSIMPEMPRVLVGIAKMHHTWSLIEKSGAFALHLLGERHLDWVWRFGLRSGRDVAKFEGVAHTTAVTGSPILEGALGWLDCSVEEGFDTGDRTAYLAAVEAARWEGGQPLTMRRLVEIGPPERLAELRQQTAHDRLVQAEDVRRWRERRAGAEP
jgi:flavin reductase (DIM6/NTAB) family NADH-FMN oxidoreductase RutF